MRFGNASTTVTGTVTPASVNTRVMPHLRPTRPMVIVNSSYSESCDWRPRSLQPVGGLGTRDPRPLEFPLGELASAPTHSDLQNWSANSTGITPRIKHRDANSRLSG